MGRDRPYEDGGGLCSLGRLKPQERPPAKPLARALLEKARTCLDMDIKKRTEGKSDSLEFMLRLAAGQIQDNPFK